MSLPEFLSQKIADYVYNLTYNDLPDHVVVKAKFSILDAIGCALGASTLEISSVIRRSLPYFSGTGYSSVIGLGIRTSLLNAVFANATLMNALDFDDTYIGHPAATIVPAGINVGEVVEASGKDLITSVVLGYEVALRIGSALRPTVERKHVHGHGTWQIFGAVVTASKILGLSPDEIVNAIGIGGANAPVPSVMKTVYSPLGPTMTKNNFGISAMAGVMSALLAKNGFRGPIDLFEGDTGFWRIVGTDRFISEEILTLGEEFRILKVAFKPYPCCRLIHSSIDALLNLMNEHNFDLNEVERIEVHSIKPLTSKPFINRRPHNIYEAQFSLPYTLACAVNKLSELEWYSKNALSDKSLLKFCDKIEINHSPEADKAFSEDPGVIPTTLVIYTRSGKKFENEVKIPKGDPRNPLRTDELVSKFRKLGITVLSEDQVNHFISRIMNLEKTDNIRALTNDL